MDPRASGRFVAGNNTNVKINQNGINKTAEMIFSSIKANKFNSTDWQAQELHPKTMDRSAVDWCFLVDTINFSFWTPDESAFRVTFHGKVWSGYFAACACVNRALANGIPLTDPAYYSQISNGMLIQIFTGDDGRLTEICKLHGVQGRKPGTCMPMIDERKAVLKEAGKILLENFDGSFYNCLARAEKSAKGLLALIVENFPSYQDTAVYKGREVCIYKRAQILVADIWRCLDSKGVAEFPDIDELTMFADYRVPQVLAFLGVLEYSHRLADRLWRRDLFKSGEDMEVELRGCSIHACELLVSEIKRIESTSREKLLATVNAVTVDNFLWYYRRQFANEVEKTVPFHRVRTIYY